MDRLVEESKHPNPISDVCGIKRVWLVEQTEGLAESARHTRSSHLLVVLLPVPRTVLRLMERLHPPQPPVMLPR